MPRNAITDKTPKNIILSAGTIHKNLKFTEGAWNFKESLIGATSGGSEFKIAPTVLDVDVDGALVKIKGLTFKQGEVATLDTNIIEMTSEIIKLGIIGQDGESDYDGYDVIESKANIEEGDYFENIAYVGQKSDGTDIIIIMDNALCTSGFDLSGKKAEASIVKYTFECYQSIDGDPNVLPYHIYTPTVKA